MSDINMDWKENPIQRGVIRRVYCYPKQQTGINSKLHTYGYHIRDLQMENMPHIYAVKKPESQSKLHTYGYHIRDLQMKLMPHIYEVKKPEDLQLLNICESPDCTKLYTDPSSQTIHITTVTSKKHKDKRISRFKLRKESFVKMMDKAEKATNLLQQQLHKREAVKEILHKHKQILFERDFQNDCLILLDNMDTLSEEISGGVLRDEYNYCLERWNTLKKAMDLTTMMSLNQLPGAWKEYAYEAFPTIDDASAYLYEARDIMPKKTGGKVFFQQKNGLVSGEGSSLFQLLALERAIQENTNVDSQLERKLNESNQENMCLAKENKELRDKHAQVIDELNIMKRDKETYTSDAMVDSQTQVSSLNEVSPENATDKTILKSVDVMTMTEAEDTTLKEHDRDPTTAYCSATEETLVKEVDSHSSSHLQDGPTNDHSKQKIQKPLCHPEVSQDQQSGQNSVGITSNAEDTTIKAPGSDPTTGYCSATEETLVTEIDSHSTSDQQDGPTNNHSEQTIQKPLCHPEVSQEQQSGQNSVHVNSEGEDTTIKEPDSDPTTAHCSTTEETRVKEVDSHSASHLQDGPTTKHREQSIHEPLCHPVVSHDQQSGQNSVDVTRPQQPQRKNNVRGKLLTSTNTSELSHYLSRFLGETTFNGINAHDLRRRTFSVHRLVVKIEKKPASVDELDQGGEQTSPIWISNKDAECIISYLNTKGFPFLCRDDRCFYFSVGSRNAEDVNLEIDHVQVALRNICFGRFFGRAVDGHTINSLEDLVISFHIEGSLDPSPWRFYYVLLDNGISVDAKQTGHQLLRKHLCEILLLLFWLKMACAVVKSFHRK